MQDLPPGFQLDAPAPSRAAGIIMGRPKAPEVTTPVQAANLEMEAERIRIAQQKDQRDQIEFDQKQAKQEAGIPRDMEDVRAELLNVIGKAGEARRKSNEWFATGFGADTAGNFAGTSARDVQSLLDTIGGNIAFDRLARMRAESPTGGALGNVTERELTLLQSTVASLDKAQSDEQFKTSMDDVIRSYGRVLAKIPGTDPNEVLSGVLRGGASKEEILALADGMGLSLNEDQLDANIASRDGGGPVSKVVPSGDGPQGGGGGSPILSGLAQGTGDIVQGIGDTVGIVTDPFARVLADALGYDGSQMQSLGTNLREGAGLPQNQNETAGRINQSAASALVGGLGARAAAPLVQAGGVAQNALATVGRTPIRDTVAGAGAGLGSSVGEEIGGAPGAVVGALAGGLGGYSAANRAFNATAPRQANSLAQAADRRGVNLLPADTGGPVARAVTTGTRASPVSVGPVTAAAETQQQQFGNAVRRTAATQGEVVDTQAAGETVRKGAQDYIEKSQQIGRRLYDRAEKQAKGVRGIKPTATVAAAQDALARMRNNPAASDSDISGLETFIANIEGGVSIQGLRDARTQLSQGVYNGALRSSSEQAMWKDILGNVADDIDAGLRSVGRDDAASTFRAADKLWSERIEVIDQTLAPIIGKDGLKSGEQVISAIEGMTRGTGGGNLRLSRLLATLPAEEAGAVRATLIDRLGRAKPGSQDAQGEAFSAATFLTNWNRMTPQARTSMFPDKSTRDALQDLAQIAEGTKRGQSLANTSNTGVALTSANVIAGGAGAAANLPATLVVAGSVYLTGKLMASPRFAKLLAQTAKLPPQAANRRFTEQLGILATREPALQGDINALLQAANDNPASRLAAEEQPNEPQ
jgi:hypothetical protein